MKAIVTSSPSKGFRITKPIPVEVEPFGDEKASFEGSGGEFVIYSVGANSPEEAVRFFADMLVQRYRQLERLQEKGSIGQHFWGQLQKLREYIKKEGQ